MNKLYIISLIISTAVACHGIKHIKVEDDSTDSASVKTYTPGLGEFMNQIQTHHIKLWYAGKAGNWKLASFELDELKETKENIEKYCKNRSEVKSINMIQSGLDSVQNAVEKESVVRFKKSFTVLTTGCNNCHKTTNHDFNVIRTPKSNPFTDQEFGKPIGEKGKEEQDSK